MHSLLSTTMCENVGGKSKQRKLFRKTVLWLANEKIRWSIQNNNKNDEKDYIQKIEVVRERKDQLIQKRC